MGDGYQVQSSSRLKAIVTISICVVGQIAMSFLIVPDTRTRIALRYLQ